MIWEELETGLAGLERDGLKRLRRTLEVPCGPLARVDGRDLISFCSNDYLGLANDPALIEAACAGARVWGVGSGASHLVSGHFSPHAELEEKLAAFTGFPRALLFSTGYMANLGIVVALAGRGDAGNLGPMRPGGARKAAAGSGEDGDGRCGCHGRARASGRRWRQRRG